MFLWQAFYGGPGWTDRDTTALDEKWILVKIPQKGAISVLTKQFPITNRIVFLFQNINPNSTGNCSVIHYWNGTKDGIPYNGTECYAGLGLTQTQFNLLYSIYAWT